MNTRIRFQEVTVKPKVFINGDSFRVEYYGPLTQGHCGAGFPTFEAAIEHGNKVARRNPLMIKAINQQREYERQARRNLKQAISAFPVAA